MKKNEYVRFGGRQAALTACRNLKMARSAQVYVRGNTRRFYEWLETGHDSRLPRGPAVWIGGDCHLGNLGPLADENGDIDVQIHDLDQSVVGNPVYDLIRLGLSLATAARGSDLPGVTIANMSDNLVDRYEQALVRPSKGPESPRKKPDSIQDAMRLSLNRSWKQLAGDRIKDTNPTIPLGKRFWPLRRDEKVEIRRLFEQEDARRLVTSFLFAQRHCLDQSSSCDVGRDVARLGGFAFAALVEIGKPPYKGKDLCLMDIKEAVKAAAPPYQHVRMPRDNAQRVVEGRDTVGRILASGWSQLNSSISQSLSVNCDRRTYNSKSNGSRAVRR